MDALETRAEALLRLARVQTKRKHNEDALAAYARLQSIEAISQADVPYSLLGRFARIQLMADTGASSAESVAGSRAPVRGSSVRAVAAAQGVLCFL